MDGITVRHRDLSSELLDSKWLQDRTVDDQSKHGREVRFLRFDKVPILPIRQLDELAVLEWGNCRGTSVKLPKTFWCREESLANDSWSFMRPKEIRIPCLLLKQNSLWTLVNQDLRGIVVKDEKGRRHVYPVTKPSTHYFRIMTGSEREVVMTQSQI